MLPYSRTGLTMDLYAISLSDKGNTNLCFKNPNIYLAEEHVLYAFTSLVGTSRLNEFEDLKTI